MTFDLSAVLAAHRGEAYALHDRYLNPQLARVLTTLGFDRTYVRGEGCYLIDDEGGRTLDFLSGFGVFALGRSHPVVKDALRQALDADLPNLAQLDCALLPGLLGQQLVERAHPGIGRVVFANSGAETVETAEHYRRQRPTIKIWSACKKSANPLSTKCPGVIRCTWKSGTCCWP